jgi:hypothetical protein
MFQAKAFFEKFQAFIQKLNSHQMKVLRWSANDGESGWIGTL